MNIYEKLAAIQQDIKVNKDQDNTFAGFKYRSAEDILEKLKPLLAKHKVTVILSDWLKGMGPREESTYIQATATMIDLELPTANPGPTEYNTEINHGHHSVSATAFAREEKTRPKMSEGQLTGAASSYARKYALNGLLLLDDAKDPDSQDNSKPKLKVTDSTTSPKSRKASDKQMKWMLDEAKKKAGPGVDEYDWLKNLLTINPEDVPLFKVKDAVDLIQKQPNPSKELDVVVTDIDLDNPINFDEVPY